MIGTRGNLIYCRKMADRGFHVFAHDHVGHGLSCTAETFGWVEDWQYGLEPLI